VSRPVYLNRYLRKADLLSVREGPFGEQLDTYGSRAFAVCDHQLAHVYVQDSNDLPRVAGFLSAVPGVAKVYQGDARSEIQLNHSRSGELVLLSEPDAWFAYPFWLDDKVAPDYARCVAIHHKPGYDPAELFLDPKIWFPKMKIVSKLLRKKLGFRMSMNVIPLDAAMVKGSHGLVAARSEDGPMLIGAGPQPAEGFPMTGMKQLLLERLGLAD
jgi:hypothetical protein